MKFSTESINSDYKFPQTEAHLLLNNNLLIFLRLWSGSEHATKVIDEVQHFISAADADLEVTTPFEYLEYLSSLANKLRIALLLANDNIRNENKDKYVSGFEAAICYKNHSEISIATLGRFSIKAEVNGQIFPLLNTGSSMDAWTLLPANLLGIDKEPNIQCTSISTQNLKSLCIESVYKSDAYWITTIIDFES